MVSRGEIWWAQPPGAKRRPYLVLMRDRVIPHVNAVISIPATRRMRGLHTEVLLDADDGMETICALQLDRIAVLAHEDFDERICTLSPPRMREVCRALLVVTGCA